MFRFTIRDVLWLTVVVALAVSWRIDSERINTGVTKLENDRKKVESDRQQMQAEFDDKLTVFDEWQKKMSDRYGVRYTPPKPNRVPVITPSSQQ